MEQSLVERWLFREVVRWVLVQVDLALLVQVEVLGCLWALWVHVSLQPLVIRSTSHYVGRRVQKAAVCGLATHLGLLEFVAWHHLDVAMRLVAVEILQGSQVMRELLVGRWERRSR